MHMTALSPLNVIYEIKKFKTFFPALPALLCPAQAAQAAQPQAAQAAQAAQPRQPSPACPALPSPGSSGSPGSSRSPAHCTVASEFRPGGMREALRIRPGACPRMACQTEALQVASAIACHCLSILFQFLRDKKKIKKIMKRLFSVKTVFVKAMTLAFLL